MNKESIDVVIVGGGQAGISLSYYLQQHGVPHIILERDRAFSSWRNRWDGFRTNTPNWMNTIPVIDSQRVMGNEPGGFATREEVVAYFDECLQAVDPPIRNGAEVCKIVQRQDDLWEVYTQDIVYETRSVAICIGAMSTPRIPQPAADIPRTVPQLHSSQYKNPEQFTTGSVLIVGSGSSGVQICRLLAESGRFDHLHMAVSNVMVLPYRFLGIQIHRFLHILGLFDVRNDSLIGKLMYSGLETKGDPIMRPTPKDFASQHGVCLYGKFTGADGDTLHFADGQTLSTEDLTVVWCTGFRGDYSFVQTRNPDAAFDKAGYPIHYRGIIDAAPGLCFVGLRYQHTVASHDIYGVGKDAKYVAEHIVGNVLV